MMCQLSFIVVVLFSMTACTVFQAPPASTTYIFTASNKPIVSSKRISLTLAVAAPKAAPGYDSAQMAYMNRAYQLSYFAKNRWVDQPQRILMPLLMQTLEQTRRFQAIVALPYTGDADVQLETELLSLYQDFTKKPVQVRMVLRAQLINLRTKHVLATREFTFSEPTPQATPYGGVIATNYIIARLLPRLGAYVVQSSLLVPQK